MARPEPHSHKLTRFEKFHYVFAPLPRSQILAKLMTLNTSRLMLRYKLWSIGSLPGLANCLFPSPCLAAAIRFYPPASSCSPCSHSSAGARPHRCDGLFSIAAWLLEVCRIRRWNRCSESCRRGIGSFLGHHAARAGSRLPAYSLCSRGNAYGGIIGGVRLFSRWLAESVRERIPSCKRALLIGAGHAAQTILREMHQPGCGYVAVGCLDDDPAKLGIRIHKVRVLGSVDKLPDLLASERVDEVLIAVPSASGAEMRRFVDICTRANSQLSALFLR